MLPDLIVILGPTAVGKTRLGAMLAAEFNGEIISADSRQVYKRMNIGTGKDYSDYQVNENPIPYHLIDIVEPGEEYNLFRFINDFQSAYSNIKAKNKLPFLIGGTGLYIDAVIKNYSLNEIKPGGQRREYLNSLSPEELIKILLKLKPVQHNTSDLTDKNRIIQSILVSESEKNDYVREQRNNLVIGILLPRDEIKKRITSRLKSRLSAGMIEEVENLLKEGVGSDKLIYYGLEYKYLAMHLRNEINYNDMFQKLNSAIYNFAKRQMTWFRKMERGGVIINWINGTDFKSAKEIIESYLHQK